MAGKRQHFVPQFLQRGFKSHFVGGEAFTWVYRKGIQPFNTNIKNIGVEGYFYSVGGDVELDGAITDLERKFSSQILSLRSENTSALIDQDKIAQLLAHLEIRTRHMRLSFLETGSYLMDELLKNVSDEDAFGRYFKKEIQRDPSLIQGALARGMQKHGIPLELLPQVIELTDPLLEQVLPKTFSYMSDFAMQFRSSLLQIFKDAVKPGHIGALQETLAPESKVNRFVELQYSVVSSRDVSLPLGDSMVLFHVSGERSFKPFLEGSDELLAVLLPLGSHHVLIGSKGSYDFEFTRLRQEIARSAREYFISSEPPQEHKDLQHLIGENAYLLSKSQIEVMVNELINGSEA